MSPTSWNERHLITALLDDKNIMLLVFNISICLFIVRLVHVVCRWMREFFVLRRLNCPISVMEGVPYQRCPFCRLKNPSVYSQLIKQVLLYIKKFAQVIRACTDLLIKVNFFLFQTWPNSPRDSLQTCTRPLSRYTVVFCNFILDRSLFSLPPLFGAREDGKKRDPPNNVMVAFDKEEGTWPIRIFPLGCLHMKVALGDQKFSHVHANNPQDAKMLFLWCARASISV